MKRHNLPKFNMVVATILYSDPCAHFQLNRCILYRICNIPTKFGENWSTSKGMATNFRNSRWQQPSSWILMNMHLWHESGVLCQFRNISTKFGEDLSNSKDLATVFRNSRERQPPSWIWLNVCFRQNRAFCVGISTFPPNLVRIGSIMKKWQQFSKFKIRRSA